VPRLIFDAVDALATDIDARVVAVGNPTIRRPTSQTYASQALAGTSKRSAHSIRRAYTGEKVPEELLPLLVSPEWVDARKRL
jgi:hypothetical protein